MDDRIYKAIKLAGTQSKLAKVLGISPQALSKQISKGVILPKHCIALEKLYPGQITRYELNPEHFGESVPNNDYTVVVLQNIQSVSKSI
jgi:DNA-binding transcriptional regulator YdaS (Cro superfamily)